MTRNPSLSSPPDGAAAGEPDRLLMLLLSGANRLRSWAEALPNGAPTLPERKLALWAGVPKSTNDEAITRARQAEIELIL